LVCGGTRTRNGTPRRRGVCEARRNELYDGGEKKNTPRVRETEAQQAPQPTKNTHGELSETSSRKIDHRRRNEPGDIEAGEEHVVRWAQKR